jgi:hypothetical protein
METDVMQNLLANLTIHLRLQRNPLFLCASLDEEAIAEVL